MLFIGKTEKTSDWKNESKPTRQPEITLSYSVSDKLITTKGEKNLFDKEIAML